MKAAHGGRGAAAVLHARIPDQRAVGEDVDISFTVPLLEHAIERLPEGYVAENALGVRRIANGFARVIVFDCFAGNAGEREASVWAHWVNILACYLA